MNKKIFAIALTAATLFTLSASAQNNTCSNQQCDNTKQCQQAGKSGKKVRKTANPFEGLNLTEEQQKAIKAMDRPCRPLAPVTKDSKGDTIKWTPRMRCQAPAADSRADYLKQLKSVLTPEQYLGFLENQYLNQPRQRPGHKSHRGKGGKAQTHNSKKTCCQ